MKMRHEIMKYERIRNLRIDKGLTQEALAKVLNIKQNTYSQYEIGVLIIRLRWSFNWRFTIIPALTIWWDLRITLFHMKGTNNLDFQKTGELCSPA